MPGTPDAGQSRYRIEQVRSEYRIWSSGRNAVTITPRRLAFQVAYKTRDEVTGHSQVEQRVGLYEFRRLCRVVANGLMVAWEPDPGKPSWPGVRRWAIRRTTWAITGRLHGCWQEMLRHADPQVLDVQRALFAATCTAPPLALEPELYEQRWVLGDVHRYRAAALAVALVPELGSVLLRLRGGATPARAHEVLQDPFADDILSPSADAARCVELLCNWRCLYAVDGHTYRSLNRTLMNLPGGVPSSRLRYLCTLRLPRPLTTRLQLILALAWAEAQTTWAYSPAENSQVVLHARPQQIAEAMHQVARYLRVDWSPRRSQDVWEFARFVADYPDRHRGGIVGLAEKAVGWHRDVDEEATQVAFEGLRPAMPTARPPIPLPTQPGVTFLDTVGAVVSEGEVMGHCVAQYAEGAVAGDHFLIHVTHQGNEATIQVGRDGRVVQACGPRNTRNRASVWGSRVLMRWGRGLARSTQP